VNGSSVVVEGSLAEMEGSGFGSVFGFDFDLRLTGFGFGLGLGLSLGFGLGFSSGLRLLLLLVFRFVIGCDFDTFLLRIFRMSGNPSEPGIHLYPAQYEHRNIGALLVRFCLWPHLTQVTI
jgi:hypothetical protein